MVMVNVMVALAPPAPTAADRIADLLRAGFRAGAPPAVDGNTRRIDREVCKGMVCGCCGKRGLRYTPFGREGAYRVVARCDRCGGGEEV